MTIVYDFLLLQSFQFLQSFQIFQKFLSLPISIVFLPVDKKAGRPVHPAPDPAFKIRLYPLRDLRLFKIAFEFFNIHPDIGRIFHQVAIPQVFLVFENNIVHLPKLSLYPGGLGRYGGMHGIGVGVSQWEITKYEFQVLSQLSLDIFDQRVGAPAMRALIIAILHQFYRGVLRALDMIPGVHCGF
jgi:hypothetical protein